VLSKPNEEDAVHSKIIVGYDGSDQAQDGLALSRVFAKATRATLLVAHVFRHDVVLTPGWEQYEEAALANAEKLLSDAASMLEDVEVETRASRGSSAAAGLQDLAEAEGADMIVLGSSHRGRIGRVLMGTVSDRLFHGASCAVAIAPHGFSDRTDAALRVIGVAFDGSPESRAALTEAARLGEAASATLRIFAVAESDIFFGYSAMPSAEDQAELFRSQKEHLEREISKALEELPRELRAAGEVLSGDAAEKLASKAEEGVDVLVMGSRGYGPARRVLLGSVSSEMARSAPCPLLVVPRTAESPDRTERAPMVSSAQ
jgi:nucleotide-binding universal stress UspA family protein